MILDVFSIRNKVSPKYLSSPFHVDSGKLNFIKIFWELAEKLANRHILHTHNVKIYILIGNKGLRKVQKMSNTTLNSFFMRPMLPILWNRRNFLIVIWDTECIFDYLKKNEDH